MSSKVSAEHLVPGGILPGDYWHDGRMDGRCSRCRLPVPERDVPLMIFDSEGDAVLVYCEACLRSER
jgi:hypothetical protein